jgi:hypothetical protein
MQELPRIPLVYILSNGRSGSTLLELLIGNHARAFTLGEFQVLPHELAADDARCGCGAHPRVCNFWSRVVDGQPLADDGAQLTQFRSHRHFGKVLRRAHLGGLLNGRVAPTRRAAAAAYGELNARLMERALAQARRVRGGPVDWLVDASKDPYRLAWLAESGRFDLFVVHLVRDPRSFVHSMLEGARRPRVGSVLRMSARWAVENVVMARLVAKTLDPARVERVTYEELASRPDQVLARLGERLGLEFPKDWSRGAFRTPTNHAVSGNRARFGSSGVALDERWRAQSPAWVQRLVWLATAPARLALRRS